MALARAAVFTAEEYRLMPDDGKRYEVLEGELLMSPAPERWHQGIASNLHSILRQYLEKNRIGVVYMAPCDVYFDDFNVAQPDLIFVSKARKRTLVKEGIVGAPDLLVEIYSPGTVQRDLKKRRIYAAHGVIEYWFVDGRNNTVEVYYFKKDREKPAFVKKENESFTSPCLPGLRISCAKIFEKWDLD
jgi:Uma2 family endonuclease